MEKAIEQLERILADQQRELTEIRRDKRANSKQLAELQAKEIEVLVGIQKTKDILEQFEGDV